MNRIYFPLLVAALVGTAFIGQARAQSSLTSFTYEVSIPMSDTKAFTGNLSWIGFKFDMRRFVSRTATIGISAGLHVLNEKVDDELIQLGDVFENERNIDVWGTQYRYINSWPLMLTGFYYIGDRRASVRPYVGSGVGFFAAKRRLDMGTSSLAETKWQFGVTPEVGFLYNMGELNLLLKGTYNYGFSSGQANALTYATIGVGFTWMTY